MIRDRGKIKWTAMVLPEHKDLINKCMTAFTTKWKNLS